MRPLIRNGVQGIKTMITLQDRFVASHGAPLRVNGVDIVQMDRIHVRHGTVRVIAQAARAGQGIALKVPSGTITLSDGRETPVLHIWFDPGLPLDVTHVVNCRGGELRVWNIFRTVHPNGAVTEDAWTGNAGMAVVEREAHRRRYQCSPGSAASWEPQLDVIVEVAEVPKEMGLDAFSIR